MKAMFGLRVHQVVPAWAGGLALRRPGQLADKPALPASTAYRLIVRTGVYCSECKDKQTPHFLGSQVTGGSKLVQLV